MQVMRFPLKGCGEHWMAEAIPDTADPSSCSPFVCLYTVPSMETTYIYAYLTSPKRIGCFRLWASPVSSHQTLG